MYIYPYGDSQQTNLSWIINEIINLHKKIDPDYTVQNFNPTFPITDINQLNLSWIISELKTLKELIPDSDVFDFEVVETYNDLLASTKKWVLVLHNDGEYGDNGACLFMDLGNQTNRTIKRNNNTYVGAVPDQGGVYPPNADYDFIMNTLKTYIGNSNLVYGANKTLFDSECTNQIDCSAFVNAVLYGITYENSRYISGIESNVLANYNITNLFPDGLYRTAALNTREMAAYYAQHKMLFTLPNNANAAARMLRFGDILFMGSEDAEGYDSYYLNIGHVALVLGVDTENNRVIIAQGGGSPAPTGNVQNSVCKISIYYLNGEGTISSEKALSNIKAFARPIFSKHNSKSTETSKYIVTDGEYYFNTHLIPCLTVGGTTHKLNTSVRAAGDTTFFEVAAGDVIEKIGAYGTAAYSFYDSNFKFITTIYANTATAPATAKYCLVYIYTSNSTPTIDDCISTKFKLSNHSIPLETPNTDVLKEALAIVSDNNTHPAIAENQKVYISNHGTLEEGLYKAIAAIAENAALSTANVQKVENGGFNEIVPIVQGGTGANNVVDAKINLEISGLTVRKFTLSPNQTRTFRAVNPSRGFITTFANTASIYTFELYNTHQTNGYILKPLIESENITYTVNGFDLTIANTSAYTCVVTFLDFNDGKITSV